MRPSVVPPPKSSTELVAEYFLENRHRILDVAAFLDRLNRAGDADAQSDFRIRALREALRVLCDDGDARVARIQMIFSDPTTEPKPELDQKAARGAYAPEVEY